MNVADQLDKLSILRIKQARLGVNLSADILKCQALTKHISNAEQYVSELQRLNEMGWESNDMLFKALEGPYPSTFGEALRLVVYSKLSHAVNQARITLKNEINRQVGCAEQEVKSWQVGANDGSGVRTSEVTPDT